MFVEPSTRAIKIAIYSCHIKIARVDGAVQNDNGVYEKIQRYNSKSPDTLYLVTTTHHSTNWSCYVTIGFCNECAELGLVISVTFLVLEGEQTTVRGPNTSNGSCNC